MENESKKSITLKIKRIFIVNLLICFGVSLTAIFLLQFIKKVNCGLIFPRNLAENVYEISRLEKACDEYKKNLPPDVGPFDWNFGPCLGSIRQPLTRNYDPCNTQSFTLAFNTFFGNVVPTDEKFYSKYTNLVQDENSGNIQIVYADEFMEITSLAPPDYLVIKKYRKFDNKMSQCDCQSFGHRILICLKALAKDALFVLISTILLTTILTLLQKYRLRIKIT